MAKPQVQERMVQLAEVMSINKQLDYIYDSMFNLLAMRDNSIKATLKPGTKYVEILMGTSRKLKINPATNLVYEAVGRGCYGTLEELLNVERHNMHKMKELIKQRGRGEYLHGVKPEVQIWQKDSINFRAKDKIYFTTWGYNATFVEFVRVYDDTPYQAKVVKLHTIVHGDNNPSGGKAIPGKPTGKTFRLQKKKVLGRPALVGRDKSGRGGSEAMTWYEWDGQPKYYNSWD